MSSLAFLFSDYHASRISVQRSKNEGSYLATLLFTLDGETFAVFANGGTPEAALENVSTAVEDVARWRKVSTAKFTNAQNVRKE